MNKSKRRGNGKGSIAQRSDGRWCAQVTTGYSGTGRRIRRTVSGKTKREVQDRLTRLQSQKLDGTLCETGRLTVAQYLERWLSDCARPTLGDSTYDNYQRMVRKQIITRIGGVQLSALTPLQVQGLYAAIERNGGSAELRRMVHVVLRRALKQAVKWGLVPRNVCDAVERPKVSRSEITPLTPEQAQALVAAAADNRMEALCVVAVTTGLRLGELLALSWENINLQDGCLMVRYTLSEVKGKLKLKEPKTEKSRRRVDLPKMAVDALHEHRKRMIAEGYAAVPYVFINRSGGWLRRSHFHDEYYKPLLRKAGLPSIRFHDLRHTAATLLLSEGVHPKVVQKRLGHSQISVTLDIYSHVLPTMQRDAADKLDRLFAAKPSAPIAATA